MLIKAHGNLEYLGDLLIFEILKEQKAKMRLD